MRTIKFSYILQHDETGRIIDKRYDIEDIENFEFRDEPHGYTLVVRRQFTGLLDKNGIEIYEGDIVKVSSYLVNGLGEVGFNRGSFVFNKFEYQTSQVLHSFSEIEVIGNIYENPHLLEANHD